MLILSWQFKVPLKFPSCILSAESKTKMIRLVERVQVLQRGLIFSWPPTSQIRKVRPAGLPTVNNPLARSGVACCHDFSVARMGVSKDRVWVILSWGERGCSAGWRYLGSIKTVSERALVFEIHGSSFFCIIIMSSRRGWMAFKRREWWCSRFKTSFAAALSLIHYHKFKFLFGVVHP